MGHGSLGGNPVHNLDGESPKATVLAKRQRRQCPLPGTFPSYQPIIESRQRALAVQAVSVGNPTGWRLCFRPTTHQFMPASACGGEPPETQ